MNIDRQLRWDGCCNVRDLGGLPTRDGRVTRHGSIVRADSLDRLTPDGWSALHAHGVRTIVGLREEDERTDGIVRPDEITVVTVALDDNDDAAFWYGLIDDDVDGTPLYYRPFLERKADRCMAALTAVARAAPAPRSRRRPTRCSTGSTCPIWIWRRRTVRRSGHACWVTDGLGFGSTGMRGTYIRDLEVSDGFR